MMWMSLWEENDHTNEVLGNIIPLINCFCFFFVFFHTSNPRVKGMQFYLPYTKIAVFSHDVFIVGGVNDTSSDLIIPCLSPHNTSNFGFSVKYLEFCKHCHNTGHIY